MQYTQRQQREVFHLIFLEQLLTLDFAHYRNQVLPFLEAGSRDRFGEREAWMEMRDFVLRLLER